MDFWANGVDRLDATEKRKPKRREGEDRPDVVCDCGYVLQPGMQNCPSCGAARRRRRTRAEVVPGRMEEWAPAKPAEWMKDESWVWSQLSRLALIRKGGDVEAAQRSASGYYKGMYGRGPSMGPSAQAMRRACRRKGIEASPTQPDPIPVRQIAEGRVTIRDDRLRGMKFLGIKLDSPHLSGIRYQADDRGPVRFKGPGTHGYPHAHPDTATT